MSYPLRCLCLCVHLRCIKFWITDDLVLLSIWSVHGWGHSVDLIFFSSSDLSFVGPVDHVVLSTLSLSSCPSSVHQDLDYGWFHFALNTVSVWWGYYVGILLIRLFPLIWCQSGLSTMLYPLGCFRLCAHFLCIRFWITDVPILLLIRLVYKEGHSVGILSKRSPRLSIRHLSSPPTTLYSVLSPFLCRLWYLHDRIKNVFDSVFDTNLIQWAQHASAVTRVSLARWHVSV